MIDSSDIKLRYMSKRWKKQYILAYLLYITGIVLLLLQQDAVHSLRKAQSLYVTRQQEYEKAKEQAKKIESDMLSQSNSSALNKVDKRRKLEEEALHKVNRFIDLYREISQTKL